MRIFALIVLLAGVAHGAPLRGAGREAFVRLMEAGHPRWEIPAHAGQLHNLDENHPLHPVRAEHIFHDGDLSLLEFMSDDPRHRARQDAVGRELARAVGMLLRGTMRAHSGSHAAFRRLREKVRRHSREGTPLNLIQLEHAEKVGLDLDTAQDLGHTLLKEALLGDDDETPSSHQDLINKGFDLRWALKREKSIRPFGLQSVSTTQGGCEAAKNFDPADRGDEAVADSALTAVTPKPAKTDKDLNMLALGK